jgi:hypothetical protein
MSVNLGDRMTSFLQTGSMTFLIETKLGGRLANYRETLMTAPSLSLKAIHHRLMEKWRHFTAKRNCSFEVCIGCLHWDVILWPQPFRGANFTVEWFQFP